MNNYLINNFIMILIDILGVWLAFWVYYQGKRDKVNIGLSLMIVTLLSWITFYHFASLPDTSYISLTLFRISGGSVFLFLIAYYFFIVRWFLNKAGWYEFLGRFIFLYGFVFAFLTFFTDYIIEYSQIEYWGSHPVFTPWGWFAFYGFSIAIAIIVITSLLLNYVSSSLEKKRKIRYFLTGILLWTILNFIFNIILQVYFNNYKFYQFGNYSTILLIGFITFAIIKNELFGVKAVITTIFVWLLTILYIIDFILFIPESSSQALALKGTTLVAYIIFGILLIRSVKKEIKQREKLEKLTLQLKVANIKLKKLDAVKSEFISIASHQLRTPLTVIKGYLSMIRDGDFGVLGEKLADPLEKIYDSSERMITLVANLLNVSRIESGKIQFNFAEIQLENLVKSVYEELQSKAKLKNLRFDYIAPAAPLPKVRIDEEKIRQVIMNLTENSIKYTNEGSVTVKLKQEGKNIRFCVYDTGAGIKKSDMGKLFQKFSRGTGSTQAIEGTGLGLFVAKQMIEAHRGMVWAESKGEGKGSKFCFAIPIGK